MVFYITISYDIYLSGGSGQATLRNTAATVSVISAAVVVGKAGVGSGTWCLAWLAAGGATLSTSYQQAICYPTCIVHVA